MKRNSSRKLCHEDEILQVKDGFMESSFHQHGLCGLESNIEQKRGLVHQSSDMLRKTKKISSSEGRKKIEVSCSSHMYSSLSIVDSLCSSDEEQMQKKSPAPRSGGNAFMEFVASNGFVEICTNVENRENQSFGTSESNLLENQNLTCERLVAPPADGNELLERDTAMKFNKSLSAKLEMPHSPPSSGSDFSTTWRSRPGFSPMRKVLDCFMKSKSMQNPRIHSADNVRRNQDFRKSLLCDLLNTEVCHQVVSSSLVHSHGRLKLENQNGLPFFEFALNSPEQIFMAKTWKAGKASNWVYTFDSVSNRKKSNGSGPGSTNSDKRSSPVGQMQVSSYLCSEVKKGMAFENSMETEFVLYDLAHARHCGAVRDASAVVKTSDFTSKKHMLHKGSNSMKLQDQHRHASGIGSFGFSQSCPWPSTVFHPGLEIVAVSIRLPLAKRESLILKRWSRSAHEIHPNQLRGCKVGEYSRGDSPLMVNAIVPRGNHSLPIDESRGPSSLLHRWRLGGGCDCAGWDMACPLSILSNPTTQSTEERSLVFVQQPLELFLQGTKQTIPTLTLSFFGEGQYAVDFHAQLTTLQAFAICVAILQVVEISSAADEKRKKAQLPRSNSSRVFINDEVKFLTEAVAVAKKNKKKHSNIEKVQHSYVLNPPFSPIYRV